MKTFQIDYHNIEVPDEEISICLGYFDGVHLGHQKLINEAIKNSSLKVALLTFNKPVSTLLNNNKSKEILTSLDDRFKLISRLGVDYYYVLHIDKDFLDLKAIDFVNMLKKMHVKNVFVGEDYRFGFNKEGNIEFLKRYFNVYAIALLEIDGKKVDSQNIISLLKEGNIKDANRLLNHHYLISGIIASGHQEGTKLGFKTANLKLNVNYVLPKLGVYKVIAYIEGFPKLAIANVGVHPSINKEKYPLVEVHIPNFDKDIYGKNISVEFLQFVREEKRFSNLEELKKQIAKDVQTLYK